MKRTKVSKAGPSKKSSKKEDSPKKVDKSKQESSDEEASTSKASLASKPDYQNFEQFLIHLDHQRVCTAASIQEFSFRKKRARVLSKTEDVEESSKGGIVYVFQ